MRAKFTDLEKNLKLEFKNKDTLRQALVHRSYLNEDQTLKLSNERLEFLGDSVISLITSSFLYLKFPDQPEGELTAKRSLLVQAKTLAKLAAELELGSFLLLSKGEEMSGGRENISLLADTFEALVGAIFIDQGFEKAKNFVETHLLSKMDNIVELEEVADYKSKLQEKIQEERKLSPTYKVTRSAGPDHDKVFYVDVLAQDQILGSGSGKSKQEAEQTAAKDALEKLP